MTALSAQMAASEDAFIAGFGRYCVENAVADHEIGAHMSKVAAAFPELAPKFAAWGALGGMAMKGLGAASGMLKAVPGALKAAPGAAMQGLKAAPSALNKLPTTLGSGMERMGQGMANMGKSFQIPPMAPKATNMVDQVAGGVAHTVGQGMSGLGNRAAGLGGALKNQGTMGQMAGNAGAYMAPGVAAGAVAGAGLEGVRSGGDPAAMLGGAGHGALGGGLMGIGGPPKTRMAMGALGGALDANANSAPAQGAPAAPGAPGAPPAPTPDPGPAAGQPSLYQQLSTAQSPEATAAIQQQLQNPEARAAFQQQLSTTESGMLEAIKAGQQPNAEQLQELIAGKAALGAAAAGVDPSQFMQQAKTTAAQFLQDGKLSQQELGQLVQTDAGKEFLQTMQQETGAQTPEQLFGVASQWMQENPMQAAGLFLGLPLMLMGAMNSMGGEGGLGSLMAMLLGGGAIAGGLGLFGGDQLGQKLLGATGLGGGQAAPAAPAQGVDVPAEHQGSTLGAALGNPQQMFQQLQQAAQSGDANAAQLLRVIDTPQEVAQFAQQYAKDPNAARSFLQQQIPSFLGMPMGEVTDQNWQGLQERLAAPYVSSFGG